MKKIISICFISALVSLMGIGVWNDIGRYTDTLYVSFEASKLPEYRQNIEADWKSTHPNAKEVSFAYYVSYDRIVCCWVNYR